MTIDIHKLIGKNPVTRKMLKPKFGYKYLGPYNDLDNQLSYDEKTGKILKYFEKPKNILDEIASRHDVCYSIKPKEKNKCDKKMVEEIDDIPFNQRPWGTFVIKNIIKGKKKLGIGLIIETPDKEIKKINIKDFYKILKK